MSRVLNSKKLLDNRFGKKGSAERDEFNSNSFAFYYSEILKHRRKQLKLSQQELANKIGKKRPYISRVENGEDLRLSNLLQIATALDLRLELVEE